jgi:tetratricopeptide (TPR) repeat protein
VPADQFDAPLPFGITLLRLVLAHVLRARRPDTIARMNAEDIERYTKDFAQAKTAYEANDFAGARRLMRGVLTRAERIWGKHSVEIVEALTWLALSTSGKNYGPSKAVEIDLHKRIHRIFRRAYGDDDTRTAGAVESCALDLWGHGKRAQALRGFLGVLKVLERHLNDDTHYRMGFVLDAVGALLIELGRAKEAVPLLERNVRAAEKGGHDVTKMIAHRLLARALIDAGRRHEAIASLDIALEIAKQRATNAPLIAELKSWRVEASSLGGAAAKPRRRTRGTTKRSKSKR